MEDHDRKTFFAPGSAARTWLSFVFVIAVVLLYYSAFVTACVPEAGARPQNQPQHAVTPGI